MQELPLNLYRFIVSQIVQTVGDVQTLHPIEQGVQLLFKISANEPTGQAEAITHV